MGSLLILSNVPADPAIVAGGVALGAGIGHYTEEAIKSIPSVISGIKNLLNPPTYEMGDKGKGRWRNKTKAKEIAQERCGRNNWDCSSISTCEELRMQGYSDYWSELLFAESIMGPLNLVNTAKESKGTTFGDIVAHYHFEDTKGKSATSIIAKNCCENRQPPVITLYRWVGRNFID